MKRIAAGIIVLVALGMVSSLAPPADAQAKRAPAAQKTPTPEEFISKLEKGFAQDVEKRVRMLQADYGKAKYLSEKEDVAQQVLQAVSGYVKYMPDDLKKFVDEVKRAHPNVRPCSPSS
jgi:hypothetical protein